VSPPGCPGQARKWDECAALTAGLSLFDARGNAVTLGDKMGSGKAIVVFLRHLG